MDELMPLMTINLAKGFFNAVQGHNVLKVDFLDYKCPNQRFEFRREQYLSDLPAVSQVYDLCQASGMPGEAIIDFLIALYFPMRFFKVGSFAKMAIVLGFIGTRGSGKTCSAVAVAICDFLLRGMPVWSNVPFAVRVCYKDAEKIFTSTPLDDLDMLDMGEDVGQGCVLIDEVNMEGAEATRYASGANLQFSYVLQQIRKRQLSFIWTVQGWNWIDNRLRWQTDYVVSCRDASFEKRKYEVAGIGDKTIWRVHDLSGLSGKFDYDFELKHRYMSDYLVSTDIFWMRPWWTAYSTTLLQGKESYIEKYKVSVAQKRSAAAKALPEPVNFEQVPETSSTIGELVAKIITSGTRKIYCRDVWRMVGSDDRAIQQEVGKLFKGKGYIRAGNSQSGRYWILKENEEE